MISYPQYSAPQGIDFVRNFGGGLEMGRALGQEQANRAGFSAYDEFLRGGGAKPQGGMLQQIGQVFQPMTGQTSADPQTAMVNASHAAAAGAIDPSLATYFANARAAESGGNDRAKNPKSTATGRYQFLDSTWRGLMEQYPELGLTAEGRTDGAQQERAMARFTQDNARVLASNGLPVNPGSLYAAHFLGPAGASSVLGQDPNSQLSAYLQPGVLDANPHLNGMSVGDFINWSNSKGTNGSGGYSGPSAALGAANSMATGGMLPAGGFPPAEVMQAMFASPELRPLAIEIAKTAHMGGSSPDPTSAMQNYQFLLSQGLDQSAALERAFGGGQTINVNAPGAGDGAFFGALDKADGEVFANLIAEAPNVGRKAVQIDQLEGLLGNINSGGMAGVQQMLGEFGINTEGLDSIQAVQALINQIVPEQRQPGSGPMSDADLALFKQSVPRIINTPGGNQMIIDTMRGINEYTRSQSTIAAQLAARQITRDEARAALAALPNPLEGYGKRVQGAQSGGVARPTSQQEYDALPSGALFIDPDDGKTYRKD